MDQKCISVEYMLLGFLESLRGKKKKNKLHRLFNETLNIFSLQKTHLPVFFSEEANGDLNSVSYGFCMR